MRGAKTDVLGDTIQKAHQRDFPQNRFVFDGLIPPTRLTLNRKAELAGQRIVPMKMIVHPQPIVVQVQNQREKTFISGGRAFIPDAGLWQNILRGGRTNGTE